LYTVYFQVKMKAVLILISLGVLGAVRVPYQWSEMKPGKLMYNIQQQPIERQILASNVFLAQHQPLKPAVQQFQLGLDKGGQKGERLQLTVMGPSSASLKAILEEVGMYLTDLSVKLEARTFEEGLEKLTDPKFRSAVNGFAAERKQLVESIKVLKRDIAILIMPKRGEKGVQRLEIVMEPSLGFLKDDLDRVLSRTDNLCSVVEGVQFKDGLENLSDPKLRSAVKYMTTEKKKLLTSMEALKEQISLLKTKLAKGEGVTNAYTKGVDEKKLGYSQYFM